MPTVSRHCFAFPRQPTGVHTTKLCLHISFSLFRSVQVHLIGPPSAAECNLNGQTCSAFDGFKQCTCASYYPAPFAWRASYSDYTLPDAIAVLVTLGGVLECICLLLSISLVYLYRAHPIVRGTTRLFHFIILAALMCCAICAMWYAVVPRSTLQCELRSWALTLSVTLILAPLLARNLRIWHIFSTGFDLQIKPLRDSQLLCLVGCLCGVQLLINTFWSIFNPQEAEVTRTIVFHYVSCDALSSFTFLEGKSCFDLQIKTCSCCAWWGASAVCSCLSTRFGASLTSKKLR